MPAVHRLGDANTGGGIVESIPQGTVYANNKLVSIDTSGVSGHSLHLPTVTANGSPSVFVNNIPVNRQDDPDACGHGRATGSPDVYVGNTIPGAPPLLTFNKPDSPPARGGSPDPNLPAYQKNPGAFKNPGAAAVGAKENNPGTPPEQKVEDNEVVKCDKEKGGGEASALVSFLGKCVSEASTGTWRESGQHGKPSNPNIINMWKNIGITWFPSDQTPWCAGFVNFALKSSGFKFLKEANAFAMGKRCAEYEGKIISTSEMKAGDLVIWSCGHINVCYTASGGRFTFVGGNQAPGKGATPPVRDPGNDGDVSISYPTGWIPSLGGIQTVIRINC